jgi:hypothetical protein
MNEDRHDTQPIGSTRQLVADLATLVRHEFDEATRELAGKLKVAGLGAGMVGASAFAGLATTVCVSALIAVLLCEIMPSWAAVLILSVMWAIATVVLALLGKRKVQAAGSFFPEQTIEHLKEDFALARGRRDRPAP